MKRLLRGICWLVLVGMLAQTTVRTQQMSEVSDPWLDRARSLTSELVKDTDSLGRYDRALLWARLGQLWQQRDVEHARAWVEQAVQAVEAAPDKGDAAEQSQCLNTARRLLVI